MILTEIIARLYRMTTDDHEAVAAAVIILERLEYHKKPRPADAASAPSPVAGYDVAMIEEIAERGTLLEKLKKEKEIANG